MEHPQAVNRGIMGWKEHWEYNVRFETLTTLLPGLVFWAVTS